MRLERTKRKKQRKASVEEKQKRKAIKRTENIDNEEKLLDDLLGL